MIIFVTNIFQNTSELYELYMSIEGLKDWAQPMLRKTPQVVNNVHLRA